MSKANGPAQSKDPYLHENARRRRVSALHSPANRFSSGFWVAQRFTPAIKSPNLNCHPERRRAVSKAKGPAQSKDPYLHENARRRRVSALHSPANRFSSGFWVAQRFTPAIKSPNLNCHPERRRAVSKAKGPAQSKDPYLHENARRRRVSALHSPANRFSSGFWVAQRFSPAIKALSSMTASATEGNCRALREFFSKLQS